jgi:hypothetical protein
METIDDVLEAKSTTVGAVTPTRSAADRRVVLVVPTSLHHGVKCLAGVPDTDASVVAESSGMLDRDGNDR